MTKNKSLNIKKLTARLLLAALFLSLCSCKTAAPEDLKISDPLPPFSEPGEQDTAGSGNTIVFDSIENDSQSTVYFYDQDFSGLSLREPTTYISCYGDSPSTYSELMNKLTARNGLIVSGYAYGLRKGYKSEGRVPKTLTQFKVEKVCFGELEQDSIIISESYYPVSENGEEYIEYDNADTMLKDNRKTLLFLIPSTADGVYWTCYGELPLPDDYQDLTDADRKELFDYYRGDRSLFNMDTVEVFETYTETIHNPDGSISLVEYEAFDNF